MKKLMLLVFLSVMAFNSCKKDEGFTQVTAFERGIHDAINKHRVDVGKDKMVLSFIMEDNAKNYSTKMANGTVPVGYEGIITELETLQSNLAATGRGVWVATCAYENVDSVMKVVLSNAEVKATIEGNFNQSAVGAVKDENGIFYITHLLLYIPPKSK
jgi:hypothetical protein